MAQGRTNTGIGEALHLSSSTVEKHVNAIFAKLGLAEEPVHRRVAAVLTYLRDQSSGSATYHTALQGRLGPGHEDPVARFDRAAALADSVIAAVRPEQLADPTPCAEWSVRQLINHVVAQTSTSVSMATAGRGPKRDRGDLGDDPLATYRDCVQRLRAAVAGPDVALPGESPVMWVPNLLVIELTVHSWDIATATGQRADIDPRLADWVLRTLRAGLSPDRRGGGYAAEQPAPAYPPVAERMAAFAGRRVQ
jgi:uncharacterized protein (TIGR03086 family)